MALAARHPPCLPSGWIMWPAYAGQFSQDYLSGVVSPARPLESCPGATLVGPEGKAAGFRGVRGVCVYLWAPRVSCYISLYLRREGFPSRLSPVHCPSLHLVFCARVGSVLGCEVAFQAPFSTGSWVRVEGYALGTFCMRSAQGREEG